MGVGANIYAKRMELGLDQKELGERIGITQAMISRYENGSRKPTLDMLAVIAKELHCKISELLID